MTKKKHVKKKVDKPEIVKGKKKKKKNVCEFC